MTRRGFGALGLVSALVSAAPALALEKHRSAQASLGLVYDVQDPRAVEWAHFGQDHGVARHALSGNPTALWREHLRPAWQDGQAYTLGCTHPDALFLLEMQARDAGQRLVGVMAVRDAQDPLPPPLFLKRVLAARAGLPARPLLPGVGAHDLVLWLMADRRVAGFSKEFPA